MASISETSRIVGVARSTLLYYERIGIVCPVRNAQNGYRDYSPNDIDTLLQVRQLAQAGFSLKETKQVMAGTLDPSIMQTKYRVLVEQIDNLIMAKEVVQSLLERSTGNTPHGTVTGNGERSWHAEFERAGAEAHDGWLRRLGFSEKESQYIRWVTRNMSNIDSYMSDFFAVFECMKRQGPGSRESTIRALGDIPEADTIKTILDIGCGSGASTRVLADHTNAQITAVDNHQPFLDRLHADTLAAGLTDRITIMNKSMFELDFPHPSFNLIWAEGSAYFMGFEQALRAWRPLITSRGYLFVSDAVWLTDSPSRECAEYWRVEYPGMTDVATRKAQAHRQGYDIISWFILPRRDWQAFYNDMETCVHKAVVKRGTSQTYDDMTAEIAIDKQYGNEYSYLCLLLQRMD